MLYWARQELRPPPAALSEPGHDHTLLLAGGLQQTLRQSGYAPRAAASLQVAQATYGAWRAQGEPGGQETQHALFAAVMEPANVRSPAAFSAALHTLAERHRFELGADFPAAVRQVFEAAPPAPPSTAAAR